LTLDIIRVWSFGHDSNIINESRSDFTYKLFEAFDSASPGLVDMQESWIMRFVASVVPLNIIGLVDDNLKEIWKMQQVSRTFQNKANEAKMTDMDNGSRKAYRDFKSISG
jgi:hypothetical protein